MSSRPRPALILQDSLLSSEAAWSAWELQVAPLIDIYLKGAGSESARNGHGLLSESLAFRPTGPGVAGVE